MLQCLNDMKTFYTGRIKLSIFFFNPADKIVKIRDSQTMLSLVSIYHLYERYFISIDVRYITHKQW